MMKPALYPTFRISNAAGMARRKYPMKKADCTSPACKREIENDFMNCRIRTSFRLLGIPHKKKSAVTRMKGTSWPAGKRRCPELCDGSLPEFNEGETAMD